MNKYVCILKSGGEYTPEHVEMLYHNVRWALPNMDEFICITDMEFTIPGVITIPLEKGYAGRWSMSEVYRIQGTVLVTGLDSVWVKQTTKPFEIAKQTEQGVIWMCWGAGGNRTNYVINGLMLWNGDVSLIYDTYNIRYAKKKYQLEMKYAVEQMQKYKFEIKILNKPDDKQLGIYSYKRNIKGRGLPRDAVLVLFHGKPSPWQINEKWIKQIREQCNNQF